MTLPSKGESLPPKGEILPPKGESGKGKHVENILDKYLDEEGGAKIFGDADAEEVVKERPKEYETEHHIDRVEVKGDLAEVGVSD